MTMEIAEGEPKGFFGKSVRFWVLLLLIAGVAPVVTPVTAMAEGRVSEAAAGPEIVFRIVRYEVQGNTRLDNDQVERLLAPYLGEERTAADIKAASQALEEAYHKAGYHSVRVHTPPQEITSGTVVLSVTEFKLGQISVSGNQYHDEANIRQALPALIPGMAPSAATLAENLRLANENPSRRLDVVLAMASTPDTVDAAVKVQDDPAQKISLTLDNTGNASTGNYRTGVAYQHHNLFNRDHSATLNYTTSPDHLDEVTQLSASYRLPLYQLGDSLDFIAAHSDVNAGTTETVAGPMSFSGKGNTFGARYNHYFPQAGEYTARLTASLDYRASNNDCTVGDFGSAGCGSASADTTVHPLGLTYSGAWNKPKLVADFSLTAAHNISGGSHGSDGDFAAARPSPLGEGGASADYAVYQLSGSLLTILPQDWRLRMAAKTQYTPDALLAGEQLGLAGANAVRGFQEREVSRDKGYCLNLEAYTPDLMPALGLAAGSLRLLAFVDYARGSNEQLAGESDALVTLGSFGGGLRYDFSRRVAAKFDLARVTNGAGATEAGASRGHLTVTVTF